MDKEQENQFKEHIKEIAREEIQRSFIDNLMETLNSAFIFKYVETLELKCKKQKEVIDKAKFAIKTNCIKNGKKYEEICCNGDYLLQILEDKEVSE